MKIKTKIREKIKKMVHFRQDKCSFLQIVLQTSAKTDCAIGSVLPGQQSGEYGIITAVSTFKLPVTVHGWIDRPWTGLRKFKKAVFS